MDIPENCNWLVPFWPGETDVPREYQGARTVKIQDEKAVDQEALDRDPALAEVVRRLVKAYEPQRIYLFGSKARADAGPDSDYDLLLIVPDSAPLARRRSRLAYEALRGTGTAVDVLVCTKHYFESRLHLKASLPTTVTREGSLLHAA